MAIQVQKGASMDLVKWLRADCSIPEHAIRKDGEKRAGPSAEASDQAPQIEAKTPEVHDHDRVAQYVLDGNDPAHGALLRDGDQLMQSPRHVLIRRPRRDIYGQSPLIVPHPEPVDVRLDVLVQTQLDVRAMRA
jgi:hypothetical protein